MSEKSFNLVTEPWIKVIDLQGNEQLVSLLDVFKNAQNYRQLAGEMKAQDLSILRFLLAILTTVYSRVDANGEPYDWLELDDNFQVDSVDEDDFDEDDFLKTWSDLWNNNNFSDEVVNYLLKYKDRFDFLGKNPFYQVSEQVYNDLVPANKIIDLSKRTGTVALKQINRTISESGNSIAVFTPKSDLYKEKTDLAEIVRWIITYHSFTGVTDKTKVECKDKFSVSAGWLYGLNPVFANGFNLYRQLLLNLDLSFEDGYAVQRPFWEFDNIQDYITQRIKARIPNNIADLYTSWSRIIHIEWVNDEPIIFSAGLPKIETAGAFIEPMTTWKEDKKSNSYRPATPWLGSLGKAMWRNFGQYVQISDSNNYQPGIVSWLQILKNQGIIPNDFLISLSSESLISDGNATSQSPAAENFDQMTISAGVLFDQEADRRLYWPARIEQTIEMTQKIGSTYWKFATNIGNLRNLSDTGEFATRIAQNFYANINYPFLDWLADLTNDDERDEKINEWKSTVRKLAWSTSQELLSKASAQDIIGKISEDGKKITNIFTFYNLYWHTVLKILRDE
ncbi:MAG: type I-E CRISPR-associated protein Cse1/CasA [Lactobacillus sp.]|jgi:CRISPR system Cascade subunit CasA|nr:type I-E CRISPR-associated protein Cse1/CasA [Lactobacillus sp.]